MRKYLISILILIILSTACQKPNELKTTTLSELQITACNTADEAGTCDTRLPELGIVLKENCCKALGKCC